jgi:hypothetical protein
MLHFHKTNEFIGIFFWRQKRKKKRVRIKRVKSDSYLTYGQSCKTYGIIRRYPPPQKKIPINSFDVLTRVVLISNYKKKQFFSHFPFSLVQ